MYISVKPVCFTDCELALIHDYVSDSYIGTKSTRFDDEQLEIIYEFISEYYSSGRCHPCYADTKDYQFETMGFILDKILASGIVF